jgi:hypothetical protein
MNTRTNWVGLGLLAMGVAGLLGWQRLEMEPLRAELAVLRDQEGEVRRLRAERERWRAQQAPAEEVERLRADRAAIGRLRAEMAAVQTSSDEKTRLVQARANERFGVGQSMPAASWRNAGAASPAAALETVLWAAAGGDVDAFSRCIQFDVSGLKAAQALLASLSPAERARHGGPAQLLAFLSIKDIPVGSAIVSAWQGASATAQPVSLALNAEGQKARQVTLVFQRVGEEWRLRATEAAVAKYAAALRGPAAGSGPDFLSPR